MSNATNLFIISGPSGSGEDSIIEGLIKRGLPIERVITTVTRDMRAGEAEGKPYYFISDAQFSELIKQDKLAEWADVYGVKRGVTKQELERVQAQKNKIGIWKIDWQGVKTAKTIIPEVVAIFIAPPDVETLIKRLEKRHRESEEVILNRTEFTKEWLKHQDLYDYVVKNEEGKLEQAIDQVIDILNKTR